MSDYEHGGGPAKMGGGAKAVVAVLVIVAIVIPIALAGALISHDPYFANAPTKSTAAVTSTSTAPPNTVYMPQGAGSGLNFSPSSITVASGTTITWVDQDTVAPHNVYFTSVPSGASQPATSPVMTKGDTFSVTLTTPGTYHYECQFHPGWMQGTIVVTG